jgi:hypothetical protein
MTIADLKRKLIIGTALEMVLFDGSTEIPPRLIGKRYIVKKNTLGFEMNHDKEATRGSFIDYPKATLCEYTGNELSIFYPAFRELNLKEKMILDLLPSKLAENKEQLLNDLLTDGTQFYYKDKRFLKDAGYDYLNGSTTVNGMYFKQSENRVVDENAKGTLNLKYKIYV